MAIENKEMTLDVAGQILLVGDEAIKKALKDGEITQDLAGQLLLVK